MADLGSADGGGSQKNQLARNSVNTPGIQLGLIRIFSKSVSTPSSLQPGLLPLFLEICVSTPVSQSPKNTEKCFAQGQRGVAAWVLLIPPVRVSTAQTPVPATDFVATSVETVKKLLADKLIDSNKN